MTAGTCRTGSVVGLAVTAVLATTGSASAAVDGTAAAAPATFVALTDPDTGPSAVAVFSTATGELVRRLTPEAPGGGASSPQVTPSGRAVVYSAGAGTCAADIMRVALDGRSAPELVVRGAGGPATSPAIAPGGRRIAYVQHSCDDGSAQLVVRRYRAGGPAVPLVAATGDQHLSSPSWSADGWLAFLTGGEGAGLHAMPARPGARTRSADAPSGCTWSSADWYTDGQGRQRLLASADCTDRGRWVVLDRELRTLRTTASPVGQRGARTVSVDATGTRAIYQENGVAPRGAVWTWDFRSGAAPRRVAQGPFWPSWH